LGILNNTPSLNKLFKTHAIGNRLGTANSNVNAVSLLLNLEAAQRGRSVLFSDEQKLLFEGGKKGVVKNTKLDFMRR
jgi:hypothetical protein